MSDHAVGAKGTVPVVITAVDEPNNQVDVRVTNNNGEPISPAATLPMGVVTVVASRVAVGDVLENQRGEPVPRGTRVVVEWVDPEDPFRWSYKDGGHVLSTMGWVKVGTFTAA